VTRKVLNFISGTWTGGHPDWIERRNPADLSEIVELWSPATLGQLDEAVASASLAQLTWAESLPETRASILLDMARLTLERSEMLARELTLEQGKTLAEAQGEIGFAAQVFRYFAGEPLRLSGISGRSIRPGVEVDVRREPLGVVAMITPWNYPFLMPAWKLAPALAHGNSVILKPSELTPGMAARLAEIAEAAGLPRGVLQVVQGSGSSIGSALAGHPDIDGITFTGSTETGRQIARLLAPHKALQMEMGGKNPLLVMADADLDAATEAAIKGAFHATGQRCTASSRIVVQAPVAEAFHERLAQRVRALRCGPGIAAETDLGPLVSQVQHDRVRGFLDLAAAEDAEIVAEGLPEPNGPQGHFQRPILLTGLNSTSRLTREEIFGPVATLEIAEDLDQAIHLVNDSDFGLSASIYTTSLAHAAAFKQRCRAGMVQVNLPTFGADYHAPFGGWGLSAAGPKELGGAIEFYTRSKTAFTAA